jgi:hypothetical protein
MPVMEGIEFKHQTQDFRHMLHPIHYTTF